MTSEPIPIDLSQLRQLVEKEIEAYVYDFPDNAIGNPWNDTAVQKGLERFRACLIEPYWAEVEIRDTFEQIGMTVAARRKCAAVADDGNGMLLMFDPSEDSFVLAERGRAGLTTFGVRGDAVGCFLAR